MPRRPGRPRKKPGPKEDASKKHTRKKPPSRKALIDTIIRRIEESNDDAQKNAILDFLGLHDDDAEFGKGDLRKLKTSHIRLVAKFMDELPKPTLAKSQLSEPPPRSIANWDPARVG